MSADENVYESSGSDAIIESDSSLSDGPKSPARSPKKRKVSPTKAKTPKAAKPLEPEEPEELEKPKPAPRVFKTRRGEPRQYNQEKNTLFIDGYEGYFDQHKQREKISTTPFSKAPQLENSEYVKFVAQQPPLLHDAQAALATKYRQFYNQWALELEQGHNIIFFGVGSKRRMIMDFIDWWDTALPVVVANGYNPANTFKEILNTCTNAVTKPEEIDDWKRAPAERLITLLKHLETTGKRLVLVVHSLDGTALRDSMSFLTRLMSCSQLSVIVSVDHINAPLLWTPEMLIKMRFIWHHTPTFAQLTTELAYTDVLSLGQNRTAIGSHGVKFVLASLTPNAKSLYKMLATTQYENMITNRCDPMAHGSSLYGIPASDLYERCVTEFIVSNEQNFRLMMAEFYEHKMAERVRKGSTETIFIPYTLDGLETILADFD